MTNSILIEKYDVPAPRYTSYPTVPYWSDPPTSQEWFKDLNRAFEKDESSWSLYIHIPFCESLCTYCGCNTTITRNHKVELDYVDILLKEWEVYKKKVPNIKNRKLKEIHLGGGTPTFLSAQNLEILITAILRDTQVSEDFVGAIEVDPRRTTKEQLSTLYKLGFSRLSLGVQDFNYQVQEIVNRIQPFEQTQKITDFARKIGYTSINFDLIYGMPLQNLEFVRHTVEKTLDLLPDRIALYSMAMVPWIKPAQRKFKDSDVPKGEDKRKLYELARKMLLDHGYIEVGMDHFSLPNDSLAITMKKKKLHRNFMGYTTVKTDVLIGLGVSSISESPWSFHQNEKVLPIYQEKLSSGILPTFRGHKLTKEDERQRSIILDLMTKWECEISDIKELQLLKEKLDPFIKDKLVEIHSNRIVVQEEGRIFIRNICMALDYRLLSKKPDVKLFSQAI